MPTHIGGKRFPAAGRSPRIGNPEQVRTAELSALQEPIREQLPAPTRIRPDFRGGHPVKKLRRRRRRFLPIRAQVMGGG